MDKKVIFTSVLTGVLLVGGMIAGSSQVRAEHNINKPKKVLTDPLVLEDSLDRVVKGKFSVLFDRPNDYHEVDAGFIEFFIPGGIDLIVSDGGPKELTWTAAVYNKSTNKLISEYEKFQHGTSHLFIPIDKSKAKEGNVLTIVFANDNFPINAGFLQINGRVETY